jgi:thioredoxin-dependent peroxiredoxin
VRAGVDEISAQPADSSYDPAFSRIQVLDGPDAAQLSLDSSDAQQVTLRVRDANNLPYPGVRVQASAPDGTPVSAVSNSDGRVSFNWTPGEALTAQLEGATGASVFVNAATARWWSMGVLGWLFSDPLPVGSAAPDFSLPDEAGQNVSLASLRGKNVLLVFYPGDNTPGWTNQLSQLRDSWDRLRSNNVLVFGVNPQSASSHAAFRRKNRLPFPLLVDRRQKVASLYHAGGLFVKRTVYLIGVDGTIRFSRRGTPPPAEILATIR